MAELSRREFIKRAGFTAAVLGVTPLSGCAVFRTGAGYGLPTPEDERRLMLWAGNIRNRKDVGQRNVGVDAALVGTLAIGTPYEPFTLERYLKAGGDPLRQEPLALSLTRFDCVTLVESCLAIARLSRMAGAPGWEDFGAEVERMRYRGGIRRGFSSRLHYFSEWISDGERRGLVSDLGKELGGVNDPRPLRFMTEHRESYPGLKGDEVFNQIAEKERSLDSRPRYFVPTAQIDSVVDQIQTGDVLAFATSIPGLDVSHSALAYRDESGVLRVLHAPLSGGSVEISSLTLSGYVAAIKRSTGILVARPVG